MLKGGKTLKEEGNFEIGKGEETDAIQKKTPRTKGQPTPKKGLPKCKKTSTTISFHVSPMLPLLPCSSSNACMFYLSTLLVGMPLLILP